MTPREFIATQTIHPAANDMPYLRSTPLMNRWRSYNELVHGGIVTRYARRLFYGDPSPRFIDPGYTYSHYIPKAADARTPDVVVIGNPDLLQLLCKASSKSQGWMKSTGLSTTLKVSTGYKLGDLVSTGYGKVRTYF